MKRLVAVAVLIVAGAVAASVALADRGGPGHGGRHHGKVVYVIEHATTDAVTNNDGRAADSVGDILTFTNDVFDKTNAHKVGSDQGYCVRMVVGQSWEMSSGRRCSRVGRSPSRDRSTTRTTACWRLPAGPAPTRTRAARWS